MLTLLPQNKVMVDVYVEVLDDVAKLLIEYKDVMPPELPRELAPRREFITGLN